MRLTPTQLRSRLRRVQLLLTDVDGVLTDGAIFITGDGEFKRFHVHDGLAQRMAAQARLGARDPLRATTRIGDASIERGCDLPRDARQAERAEVGEHRRRGLSEPFGDDRDRREPTVDALLRHNNLLPAAA